MRPTMTTTAACLLGLALLTPATAATAVGETCRGEAATIIGGPGVKIVGTEGRDVVVTNRSQDVTTLGGDDLVCLTGPDQRRGYRSVEIDTGAGDDVVDGTAAPDWPASGSLGAGADTFYGGSGSDYLEAGDRSVDFDPVDADHDVLSGGGGSDTFVSGQDALANTDVIDLGSGDDYLTYLGTAAGTSAVSGGSGDDVLSLSTSATAITVDNSVGRSTEDARPSLTWTGMEGFTVWTTHKDPLALSFRGTGADESLAAYSTSGVVHASMGGGKDTFTTSSVLLDGSIIDGGGQRDSLYAMDRGRDLALDLESKRLVTTDAATSSLATVTAFEDATLHARTVKLAGDTGHNDLTVSACRGTVRGRAGNDSIRRGYDYWFETAPGCRERYLMIGGAGADDLKGYGGADKILGGTGHDVLEGGNGNDTLLGGRGRDRADGGPGRDRCVAERTRRCER